MSGGFELILPKGGSGGSIVFLMGGEPPKKKPACALCRVPVPDWNADLSPWPSEPCFRDGEAFAGGADAFLEKLLPVIRQTAAECGAEKICLAGYSLAGLFALYAACKTDLFDGIAAMSPSVWYPGWETFIQNNRPARDGARFYLSAGRKELISRNPVLSKLESGLKVTTEWLEKYTGQAVPCVLHNGGHYTEVSSRIDSGVAFLTGGTVIS